MLLKIMLAFFLLIVGCEYDAPTTNNSTGELICNDDRCIQITITETKEINMPIILNDSTEYNIYDQPITIPNSTFNINEPYLLEFDILLKNNDATFNIFGRDPEFMVKYDSGILYEISGESCQTSFILPTNVWQRITIYCLPRDNGVFVFIECNGQEIGSSILPKPIHVNSNLIIGSFLGTLKNIKLYGAE